MAADPTAFDFTKGVDERQLQTQLLLLIATATVGQVTGALTAQQKANLGAALQAIVNKITVGK